jgi:hypothetical protein
VLEYIGSTIELVTSVGGFVLCAVAIDVSLFSAVVVDVSSFRSEELLLLR